MIGWETRVGVCNTRGQRPAERQVLSVAATRQLLVVLEGQKLSSVQAILGQARVKSQQACDLTILLPLEASR